MKHFLLVFLVLHSAVAAMGQQSGSFAVNAYGGYTFRDKVNFDGFYGYVNEAFQYGGGLEYFLARTKSIELKYLRMDTEYPLYAPAGTKLNEGKEDGSVSYIMIGANNYMGNSQSKALPYAGVDLGVGIVDLKDGGSSTKFAWGVKLGVKMNTSSVVSLKLQTHFQHIVSAVGNDFYYYPGGGVVAIPDYTSIFQFGLGAVLSFNLKPAK